MKFTCEPFHSESVHHIFRVTFCFTFCFTFIQDAHSGKSNKYKAFVSACNRFQPVFWHFPLEIPTLIPTYDMCATFCFTYFRMRFRVRTPGTSTERLCRRVTLPARIPALPAGDSNPCVNDMCHILLHIFQDAHSGKSNKYKAFVSACNRFQPVFRHFLLERFPDPAQWYTRRTAYTRSVATNSIGTYGVCILLTPQGSYPQYPAQIYTATKYGLDVTNGHVT